MPNAFGVKPLQSSNTRKIDLYSKHLENKLQVLTKAVVTFEQNAVQTQNLYRLACY